jgi:nucleoside-diphosphate-sugar epimerase
MNILVTGGSGFIGTNLVSELMKNGHRVVIFDKRKSAVFPDHCILADMRDQNKLTEALVEIDAVYHLAAEHHDNVQPETLYYDVNVGGARNLVSALKKNNVKKLIFTSSAAVYGINAGEPDETSPINPFNDYGKSKYDAEIVFNRWAKEDNSRGLVIVRPTVIFGEGNRGNVYNLIRQIASGRFVMVGKGKNKKSMGYVGNLVAFLRMLLNSASGSYLYNYADKPDLDMNSLVKVVLSEIGKNHDKILRIPYGIGIIGGYVFEILSIITEARYPISSMRIKKFCANTVIKSKNIENTGFETPVSLIEGLKYMISTELQNFLETSENY